MGRRQLRATTTRQPGDGGGMTAPTTFTGHVYHAWLHGIALEESMALRSWARDGRKPPRCRPLDKWTGFWGTK